jgi:hypothetical protein
MGTITRSFANNLTTGGVLKADAFNNASLNNVTALNAAIATGNMILLSSQTASASASISFTTGIDSTYKEYQFYFINIHPSSDSNTFQFQGSTDGGSNYGVNITSTFFRTYHDEADTGTGLEYVNNSDLAQSTSFQPINQLNDLGSDNDQNLGGTLTLFNPASTTYVKHFINTINYSHPADYSLNTFMAGYFNTTSAINAIQFKMASGNIDDGTILMFGIK